MDLSAQTIYYYIDGELFIESPCVTGHMPGMKTPGGLYQLNGKSVNTTLVGPGYASFVYYWMPFNRGIGMHDATWRSSFGDDIYQYNGSHGCVNLPLEVAGEIYHNIEVGTPIICYWEDEIVEVEE